MNNLFLVCPDNEQLINSLSGYSLVPVIASIGRIESLQQLASEANTHLHCIIINSRRPLSSITFKDEWRNIPIALFIPGVGNISSFMSQLETVKKQNLRIYLSANQDENLTAARILSSLGVETAIVFDKYTVNWDLLRDLAAYAIYNMAARADIAPFGYLKERYNPVKQINFESAYFNDPEFYLHLDDSGRVALTQEEYDKGEFISKNVSELATIRDNVKYLRAIEQWREHFLSFDKCACCPAWKVCMGNFQVDEDDYTCRDFFLEIMRAIETISSRVVEDKIVWQP